MPSDKDTPDVMSIQPFRGLGRVPSEAMAALQGELLATYEKASNAWLARVKSEVDLWSELAERLSASPSLPGAMDAYTKSVAQRMQLIAEDGQRLIESCQEITRKVTDALKSEQSRGYS